MIPVLLGMQPVCTKCIVECYQDARDQAGTFINSWKPAWSETDLGTCRMVTHRDYRNGTLVEEGQYIIPAPALNPVTYVGFIKKMVAAERDIELTITRRAIKQQSDLRSGCEKLLEMKNAA